MFELVSNETRDSLLALIDQLHDRIHAEAEAAFLAIIDEFSSHEIYSLMLYFTGGSWSYLFPSILTEQGLDRVAEEYTKHSVLSFEENRSSLRWSPCDSPYHGTQPFLSMMPQTEQILESLTQRLEEIDVDMMTSDGGTGFEDSLEFSHFTYDLIHQRVVSALVKVAAHGRIKTFMDKTGCVITLDAGDWSRDNFLDDLQRINGQSAHDRVLSELELMDEISERQFHLNNEKMKQDMANPPVIGLTLEDFSALIENFNPALICEDGIVVSKSAAGVVGLHESTMQEAYNRIGLMDILRESPHFDEIDRLFGHFLGSNFQDNDLLPQIGRALVSRLAGKILHSWPDYSFFTHLSVDRNQLYRISFVKNQQDGYTFMAKTNLPLEGVQEVRQYGSVPATVKLPVGLFTEDDIFFAQMFGIVTSRLHTLRSGHDKVLLASSTKSYDEAKKHLMEMAIEHLDKALLENDLFFDSISYLDVEPGSPNEYESVPYVDIWDDIEIAPAFMKIGLIQNH